MKAYVIKRDDGKYYNHYAISLFDNNLIRADLFMEKSWAEYIMQLIISKEELMVVAVEIKEIQEQE